MKQLLTTAIACTLLCSCGESREKTIARTELKRLHALHDRTLKQLRINRKICTHLVTSGESEEAVYYQFRTDSLRRELEILELKEKLIETKLELMEQE